MIRVMLWENVALKSVHFIFNVNLSKEDQAVSSEIVTCVDYKLSQYLLITTPCVFLLAPSAVRNVHARPFSSKSVEITWTAPNQTRGTIVTYTVYYKTSDVSEFTIVHRLLRGDLVDLVYIYRN